MTSRLDVKLDIKLDVNSSAASLGHNDADARSNLHFGGFVGRVWQCLSAWIDGNDLYGRPRARHKSPAAVAAEKVRKVDGGKMETCRPVKIFRSLRNYEYCIYKIFSETMNLQRGGSL